MPRCSVVKLSNKPGLVPKSPPLDVNETILNLERNSVTAGLAAAQGASMLLSVSWLTPSYCVHVSKA